MDLHSKKCIPCEGGVAPLTKEEIASYMKQISGEWKLTNENNINRLRKRFKFSNFKEAVVFVNKVADVAEQEGHHPNIFIFYNKIDIELYTHAIKGLHENDFILAAKIDNINIKLSEQ